MTDTSNAVFLSYASEDSEAAARICATLRAAGIEVWFDQSELRGGDAWDRQIKQQIHECALFIPIISAHSQSRLEGYFRREWKLASERTHDMAEEKAFLVPVVIDDTSERRASVPDRFREMQWSRLPGGETSPAFCERVKALLGVAVAAVPHGGISSPALAIAKRSSHRWIVMTIAAAVVVLGGAWQAWRVMTHMPSTAEARSSATSVAVVPDKSIAVLPFVDMSEKHDQEYFSDGLSEELIDHLSHIADLKVIARTSSFAFKGKNEDMRTIATKLGVAHLLEGSVRKAGTQLRITVQLIRAGDGAHLWSETYDRKLTDVFKVQEEIAATVASALKATLQERSEDASDKGVSVEAHNLYLQGRYFAARATLDDMNAAVGFYQKALNLDSGYAVAWAALSTAYAWNAQFSDAPVGATTEKARAAARTALRLAPQLTEAHRTLALIQSSYDYDWVGARSEVDRAVALEPHNPDNLLKAGGIAWAFGEADKSIQLYQDALKIDPLRADGYMALGATLFGSGRLDESMAALRACARITPGQVKIHFLMGQVALAQGHPDEARTLNAAEMAPWYRLTGLAIIEDAQDNRAASDAALTELIHGASEPAAAQIAEVYSHRHDIDSALSWLERGFARRDPGLRWLKVDPLYKPLRGDPRFDALLRKLKLVE